MNYLILSLSIIGVIVCYWYVKNYLCHNKSVELYSNDIQEKEHDELFLLVQSNMQWDSLTFYHWYRKLYGGTWRLLKLGKDTPDIRLFSVWTKEDPKKFSGGDYKVLETETYPLTGVDTRWKLWKQLFKTIFKKT